MGTRLWASPKAREPVAAARRHGAVQVIGQADGFVEVALDWRPDADTAYCWPPAYPLALRVFVRKDELQDVVTKTKVVDFGDGTGLSIAPGAAVQSSSDGLRLSSATVVRNHGGVSAVVPADTDLALGKIYTPARDSRMHDVSLEPGTVRAGSKVYDYLANTPVFAYAEHDPSHVLYGAECLQIAGFHTARPERSGGSWVDERSHHDDFAVDLGGLIGKGGPQREFENLYEIPANAALSWPNGATAGTSVRALWIQRKPIRRGSRRCFTLALDSYAYGGDMSTLEFCVGATVAKFIG